MNAIEIVNTLLRKYDNDAKAAVEDVDPFTVQALEGVRASNISQKSALWVFADKALRYYWERAARQVK